MNNDDFVLKTPVVFIVFNRPDLVMRVFERIRRARPPKLFIIADGPRASRGGFEIEACRACRSVKDMVDWDCEVFTNFSDVNMGCKGRVSSGLTWVFEHVDEAIILEDDCQPSMSFFRFCQEMLEKYRNDNRVMSISGTNHYSSQEFSGSYCFNIKMSCWGWATWKRAWDLYDIDMKLWSEFRKHEYMKNILDNEQYLHLTNEFQLTYENLMDSWAYRFCFCQFVNNGLCAIPKTNMIRNIGCNDQRGAHPYPAGRIDKDLFYMDEEMEFPIVHQPIFTPHDRLSEPQKPRPSSEEINLEFQQNNAIFRKLIQEQNYSAMFSHFKTILRDCKFFHLNYVYYLAYAYLMVGDFDHAFDLCNDILRLGNFQADAFEIFISSFMSKGRVDDGLKLFGAILQKNLPMTEQFKDNMKKIISANESVIGSYPQIAAFIAK